MSLYGMMRTSVSGMNAQANRLSTVADNIANTDTTGYKKRSIEFSTLVVPGTEAKVNSGGVISHRREAVSAQGVLSATASFSDLAIEGNGFFIVRDATGSPFMTRAGSFIMDGDGRLVNSGGYYLTGYSLTSGSVDVLTNSFDGLEVVTIDNSDLVATPSTVGAFTANLPSDAAVSTDPLPSSNSATAGYTEKSSMVVYDNLGGTVTVDIYYTKTADDTWEVAIYDQADAAAGGGFPYGSAALASGTLDFDPTNGKLAAGSTDSLTFNIPGGQPFTLDLADMTQLAAGYTVQEAVVDGNAPSRIESVSFDTDGTLYAQYDNGTLRALYRIPLATVVSPDQLISHTGNVYSESPESGNVLIGFADEGNRGRIVAGALESSNVDLAEELTTMIQSQRSYTANSKVFQTGSDLMDILVNLKR